LKCTILGILAFVFTQATYAKTPNLEEIWLLVQRQQEQIAELQQELAENQLRLQEAQKTLQSQSSELTTRITETETALEATVSSIESSESFNGTADTRFGGYGELHYNNLDSGNSIDYHRFVILMSHQFSDELSFFSELEVEHALAGDGKPGEIELEQAFVQWDYADNHHSKMGLFLVPVGILNETHEPDTFHGVERNAVEKNIIPSTWWEAGFGFTGEIAPGWGYDLAAHSGLNLDTDNNSASKRSSIRSARQKVAKGVAENLAYTVRLRYSGHPGFQWNTTLQYQSDLAQGDDEGVGVGEISATLFETNVNFRRGGFGLRALYARWDIDNEIELLNSGADEQTGWYIEPSYRFDNGFGLFARFGSYDLTAGSDITSSEKNQFDVGVNYWIHENVVIKADYQRQDNDNGDDVDGFNLGIGYSF